MPVPGFYREMLNTDSHIYGGSNVGNAGGIWAHHGQLGRQAVAPLAQAPAAGGAVPEGGGGLK